MFDYDFQMSERRVGHTSGYNHTLDVYEVDVTTYGLNGLSDSFRDRIVKMIRAKHDVDGMGGSYVQGAPAFSGLVGSTHKQNPYSKDPENVYEYGVYRFSFTVRTSGTD